MAIAIGTRAAKHGHTIELMSRNTAKAQAPADQIGNGATAGTFGATPLGDIAIVAVPYTNAVSVVANYGESLAGKILVGRIQPPPTRGIRRVERALVEWGQRYGHDRTSLPPPLLKTLALRRLYSGGRPTRRFAGCGTRRPPTHELSVALAVCSSFSD